MLFTGCAATLKAAAAGSLIRDVAAATAKHDDLDLAISRILVEELVRGSGARGIGLPLGVVVGDEGGLVGAEGVGRPVELAGALALDLEIVGRCAIGLVEVPWNWLRIGTAFQDAATAGIDCKNDIVSRRRVSELDFLAIVNVNGGEIDGRFSGLS